MSASPRSLRIGLDIGGTKTEAVLLAESGEVARRVVLPTRSGGEAVLTTSEEAIRSLLAEGPGVAARCHSVGIGIPGQVDRETGDVRNAVNLGIEHLPLGRALSHRLGVRVTVDNDVTAAALGAVHLLRLRGTVAYLNLGTGLAAGIVVDGVPWRGASGVAGEIGHIPLDPLGLECPCGQRGCLETAASGAALRRNWPEGGSRPAHTILDAVAAHDAAARAALDRLVWGAASCVRLLALSFDPHTVVIGGGLRMLGAPLESGIRATLDGWAARSPFLEGVALSSRVQVLAPASPAAAVGAALAGES